MTRYRLVAVLLLTCFLIPAAHAHPVPRDNHDRTLTVSLTADALVVEYRLELDEVRAVRDLRELAEEEGTPELARAGSAAELYAAFTRLQAPLLANSLVARLDGAPLAFTCVERRVERLDHLRCDFRFRAPWRPAAGQVHTLDFREANYERDTFSRVELRVAAGPGVTLRAVHAPDTALIERPASQRGPGDDDRLRTAQARFERIVPAESDATMAPAGDDAVPPQAEAPGRGSPLHRLLDSRHGLAVLLLLAAGFGAVHALTPGHGKTLVAAYLVGERGTIGHALLLGLTTTLTHTGAVLVLAVVLPLCFPHASPATVQAALGLVGGLLIAGLGFWLLLRRLSGQADHFHLFGDHHHAPAAAANTWHVIVLGISGGIVPCGEAFILLFLAVSTQRLWLGLPLLLAFSAGLASVLVALGIGVVQARRWAGARWGQGERLARLVRVLPLVSAALITVAGLWLCFASMAVVPPGPH